MRPDERETIARRDLAEVLENEVGPDDIGLDHDLSAQLGLTSINKVLLLTSLCEDTGIDLSRFTEDDLAGMTTLRTVLDALARHDEAVTS